MNLLKDKICKLLDEIKDLNKIDKESFFQYCVEQRLNDSLSSYQADLKYENKSLLYKCKSIKSLIKLLEITE